MILFKINSLIKSNKVNASALLGGGGKKKKKVYNNNNNNNIHAIECMRVLVGSPVREEV